MWGIEVINIKYIISQFADVTTITLGGSERCLYVALNTLQFFARFSELKINIETTKLIWIGSKNRWKLKLCQDWNFDWFRTKFTLLGIHFDVDLENMV